MMGKKNVVEDVVNPHFARVDQRSPPLPLVSCGDMKRRVLECLSEGLNVYRIAVKLKRHRSTVQQHLRELRGMGLAVKNGCLWYVSELGSSFIRGGLRGGLDVGVCDRGGRVSSFEWLEKVRSHNLKVIVEVVDEPVGNWLDDWKVNDKMRNNVFYVTRFGDIVITYTGRSLVYQLPILNFESTAEALAECGRVADALSKKLEGDFVGLRLGSRNIKYRLISQHHAIPNDPFAVFCVKHGFSFGDGVVEVDASRKNVPELEFVSSEKAHIHHERYVEHTKDILLNDVPKISDIVKIIRETNEQVLNNMKQIGLLTQSQSILTQSQLNTTSNVSKLVDFLREKDFSKDVGGDKNFYI